MSDGRIVDFKEYGQHIALRCKNHPELRWSTKNISPIGARTLFYDLMDECRVPECDCKLGDLEPVPLEAYTKGDKVE